MFAPPALFERVTNLVASTRRFGIARARDLAPSSGWLTLLRARTALGLHVLEILHLLVGVMPFTAGA